MRPPRKSEAADSVAIAEFASWLKEEHRWAAAELKAVSADVARFARVMDSGYLNKWANALVEASTFIREKAPTSKMTSAEVEELSGEIEDGAPSAPGGNELSMIADDLESPRLRAWATVVEEELRFIFAKLGSAAGQFAEALKEFEQDDEDDFREGLEDGSKEEQAKTCFECARDEWETAKADWIAAVQAARRGR